MQQTNSNTIATKKPILIDQPKLTLPSITNSKNFTFPTLYSFPPFFTKQPNEQSWSHQLNHWKSLILDYSKHHKLFQLDLTEEQCQSELFKNKSIDRRLYLPTLRLIIEAMIKEGTAAYDPPPASKNSKVLPTSALIYWKRPEEWANLIFDWVKESGLGNSVMTLYELAEGGDLAHTTEFYKLPDPLLRRALDILIKAGKAQVFKGEDGDGVKFAT